MNCDGPPETFRDNCKQCVVWDILSDSKLGDQKAVLAKLFEIQSGKNPCNYMDAFVSNFKKISK